MDIVEAGGYGLTPDYLSFRNSYWGQTQPTSYAILWKIFNEVPEVFGAIKTKADFIVADGWEIDARNDTQKEKVGDMLRKNAFNLKLKDTVFSQSIYGDAYFELVRANNPAFGGYYLGNLNTRMQDLEKRIEYLKTLPGTSVQENYVDDNAGAFESEDFSKNTRYLVKRNKTEGLLREFYPRDAATIRIDYNEHGTPLKYIQRVLHRRVDFYPDEMVHFKANVIGGRQYGLGSLASLIRTARIKFDAEEYSGDWLQRAGIPRMMYQFKNYDEVQLKRFTERLQNMRYNQDVVVVGDVVATAVAPKNVDMQWAEFLKYLREQIFVALQVPPALIGIGDKAGRGTADVNMDMFDKNIKNMRRELEDTLNLHFFTKDLFGYEGIEFHFKEDNTRDELRRAQKAQLLSSIQYISPDEIRGEYGLPPLAEIDQSSFDVVNEMSKKKAEIAMIGKPALGAGGTGKFDNKNPNAANPQGSIERQENAQVNNSEKQKETKKALAGHERILQGSNTVYESEYDNEKRNSTNTDNPERRYPFGAEPVEETAVPKDLYERAREVEVREVQTNPAGNAFDLNHDRIFPHDQIEYRKPYRAENEKPKLKDPERDEITEAGDKDPAWSNIDPKHPAKTSEPSDKRKKKMKPGKRFDAAIANLVNKYAPPVHPQQKGLGSDKAIFYDGVSQDEADEE